jgi:hypothetical protein
MIALTGRRQERAAAFQYAVYTSGSGPEGWIALDGSLASIPSSRWLKHRLQGEAPVITVNLRMEVSGYGAGKGSIRLSDFRYRGLART